MTPIFRSTLAAGCVWDASSAFAQASQPGATVSVNRHREP
jgi:hypothetical protein